MNRVIGVDPGKKGGICILDNVEHTKPRMTLYSMPKVRGTNEVDVYALAEYFPETAHVFLEEVHAIKGSSAKSTFTFGHMFGMIQGIVAAKGLLLSLVQPKVWQAVMHKNVNTIYKPGNRTTKDVKGMSRLAAGRLFPGEAFYDKDGLIDAALIAEYGRRQVMGEDNGS